MRYGHFDDEHREYVITRPDTPLPWAHASRRRRQVGPLSVRASFATPSSTFIERETIHDRLQPT